MLSRGQWRATNQISGKIIGFHISSLYSPVRWYSWNQAVQDFLYSQDNEQLLKVWINTMLGEAWLDKGELPDWRKFFEHRESYPIGTIPKR